MTAVAGGAADVIVVGAGPAGSSAAWWGTQAGLDVRQYVRTPHSDDAYLDISFDLTERGPSRDSMPGYGWVFGMGDGTANVGFGLLDRRRGTGAEPRAVLREWLATLPPG